MFRYLLRVSKDKPAAHVWTGKDTACRMWSSGGLSPSGMRLAESQMGHRLCKLCAEESGTKDQPGNRPEGDINEILRALQIPSHCGWKKPAKKKKRRADRHRHQENSNKLHVSQKVAYVQGIDVRSVDFLHTYEWRRVRMEALKKYGPRCQCCGASPETGAVMNVDHIKPRKLFPNLALDVDNLQILCHECNHGKGNWDMTDWRPETEEIDPDVLAHLRSIMRHG